MCKYFVDWGYAEPVPPWYIEYWDKYRTTLLLGVCMGVRFVEWGCVNLECFTVAYAGREEAGRKILAFQASS